MPVRLWFGGAIKIGHDHSEVPLSGALLVGALVAAGVLLSTWQSELSFWVDEWDFLLHRSGFSPDAILAPHNEHIAVVPVLIYKTLQSVFGMDSPRPFQVAGTMAFLVAVALAFVYMQRRIDSWLALACVLPVLVFGPSWIDLLWPFQMAFWWSLIGGIGALLMLERRSRRADLLSCLLLTVSMASSSLGIPFAIGCGVLIAADRDRRRRAFVVLAPIALFAIWWLGWGIGAENHVTFENLFESPIYVVKGVASSFSSVLGLSPNNYSSVTASDWRWPLLALAIAAAGWRILRLRGGDRWLWATLTLALSFWFLAATNASIFRPAEGARYQVIGAILLLLVVSELLRGVRVPKLAVAGVLVVAVAASVSNLAILHNAWKEFSEGFPAQRAGLSALEIGRNSVDPAVTLDAPDSDIDGFGTLDAGSYLEAVDEHGSPAYSQPQLVVAPEEVRETADRVLAALLDLRLVPLGRGARGNACLHIGLSEEPAIVRLGPGEALLRADARTEAAVALRRFATSAFPVQMGALSSDARTSLAIPADNSRRPWELGVTGTGSVTACARTSQTIRERIGN